MKPKKQSKRKDILFILISSFIVVVAWIAFSIYHIYITSTISDTIQAQLTPINPTFDPQTIKDLLKRSDIVPAFDIQTTASSEATAPTPTISLYTQPPASASSEVTPEASTSGISRQGQ
jgi:hypothetical protein